MGLARLRRPAGLARGIGGFGRRRHQGRKADVLEYRFEFVAFKGLFLDELLGQFDEFVLVIGEDFLSNRIGFVNQLVDFTVDLEGGSVAVVPLLGDFASEEDHLLLVAEGPW